MSTDNAEQPVKRKSVADMWREREQAMLEKQEQPYKATSPPRRSFKSFEEKKIDDTAENGTSSNREAAGASNTGDSSTPTRRPVSTKSKFAMMGQKHAARPKKLPTGTYQQYQQQTAKNNDPKSPDSENSDALLGEAFDDAVAAQEGRNQSTSRKNQSDGIDAKPSEYSSLQVSDSASIPKDVKHSGSAYNDDASNISGLSSPGSPARSSRNQRRSNAILETPENDEATLDSEGHSAGSTVSPGDYQINYPENMDELSVAVSETLSEGMEVVGEQFNVATEAVVRKGFVKESDKEVSAFQDAMQKMTLEDIANDMKGEANALFAPIGNGISKMHNDLNESMASASEKFSALFAKKEEEPAQAEKSADTLAEGDAATTPVENSETAENAENDGGAPTTETPEDAAETAKPDTEPAAEAVAKTAGPTSEEPSSEVVGAVAGGAESAGSESPETEKAAPSGGEDDDADAPDPPLEAPEPDDPPLEAPDSSEVFDPFASGEPGDFADFADFADFSAFPNDAFSSNFAVPAPAPTPVEPILPKKESSPQRKPVSTSPARRKAPPAHEEVAIEVEYMEDSDDDQADV